jgi:hypothetical protein
LGGLGQTLFSKEVEMPSIVDQIQWQALGDQARRLTYCLLDRTTNQPIGTAIAIQLGQRFFFATAKHVIENDHDVAVLPHGNMGNVVSDFAGRYYDEQLDIGLLELMPGSAHRFEFADRARLSATVGIAGELPVLVTGYPGQFVLAAGATLTSQDLLRIVTCIELTVRSVLLPQSEWPENDSLDEPLVAERDILVDFGPEPRVTPLPPGVLLPDASPVDCNRVDPHGLSGGGIWLAQVRDQNGLWVSDVRLIGIQTGWYEHSGWLRGVQIGAWLNMVRAEYPDVAAGASE